MHSYEQRLVTSAGTYNILKTISLAESTAHSLQESIIFGQYTEGARLPEIKIAQDFDVSRSTVREALLILQNKHLIDIFPNRGAVVTQITSKNVFFLGKMAKLLLGCVIEDAINTTWNNEQKQTFEVLLEQVDGYLEQQDTLQIFQKTFEYINTALLFSEQQGNRYLLQMIENILPSFQRDLYKSFLLAPDQSLDKTVRCLKDIFSFTLEKNVTAAQAQLDELINHLMDVLINALNNKANQHIQSSHS